GLVVEVMVDGGRRHPGAHAELSDREVALGEQVLGGRQDGAPRGLRVGVAGADEGGAERHGGSYSAAIVRESIRTRRTFIGSVAVAFSEPATGPEAAGLVLLDEVPVVRPPARPGRRGELGCRVR